MNLPDNVLGEGWFWAAWLAWLPLFARSIWLAPWKRLQEPTRFNLWLGLVVVLTLIWSLKAGVKPGLTLHLLGATVFTLCFGPRLAFIGMSGVLAGITLNGNTGWLAFAMNSLLMAGAGSWISYAIYRVVETCLPRQFFVYIFINAFFGAALTVIGVGAVACLLFAVAGAYSPDYLLEEYFPYFLLLGFAEAWLSGMVMTLFVIYRPEWVATFDDSRYLTSK